MITVGVQNKQSHLEAMARHVPDGSKVGSREKKFARFTRNEQIDEATYFLPFLTTLLLRLASTGPFILIMDASETGRCCLTLMVSVVYQGRALPIVWQTVQGKKGYLSETVHLGLLRRVQAIIPVQSDVIFLFELISIGSSFPRSSSQRGVVHSIRANDAHLKSVW